jgi:FkbM family methyltransferase
MNKNLFGDNGVMRTTCGNDHRIEKEDEVFKHKKSDLTMRKKIQIARTNAGLTQKELAHKLNVKIGIVQGYENGTAIAVGRIIQQIEKVCNLEYGEISGKTRKKKVSKLIMNFYSQQGEDFLIYRNFINMNENKDGIFLELGACNGLLYSNTKFFEDSLGFTGILVEPVKHMYDSLIKNRKNCICINKAISNTEKAIIIGNGPTSGIKNTMTTSFINSWHSNSKLREVECTTLYKIFIKHNIKYIDFFSLDVEGGELNVLKTIDWENIEIYLICIELDDHSEDKNKKCREILQNNGFIFQLKMCINEFWINPSYSRKHLIYKENRNTFTGNMNHYGKHIYLERHCKPIIETAIMNYESN